MSGEEKTRISGETARGDKSPVLPTTNQQAAEKSQPAAQSLHPAFYVM